MFILYAHTPGDDLIAESKTAVMADTNRTKLDNELDRRKNEREWWLQLHGSTLPGWAWANIIDEETIEEVPELV